MSLNEHEIDTAEMAPHFKAFSKIRHSVQNKPLKKTATGAVIIFQ